MWSPCTRNIDRLSINGHLQVITCHWSPPVLEINVNRLIVVMDAPGLSGVQSLILLSCHFREIPFSIQKRPWGPPARGEAPVDRGGWRERLQEDPFPPDEAGSADSDGDRLGISQGRGDENDGNEGELDAVYKSTTRRYMPGSATRAVWAWPRLESLGHQTDRLRSIKSKCICLHC